MPTDQDMIETMHAILGHFVVAGVSIKDIKRILMIILHEIECTKYLEDSGRG